MKVTLLQFGHVGEDVETTELQQFIDPVFVLQFGHVGEDVETKPFGLKRTAEEMLQFGHVGEDVETDALDARHNLWIEASIRPRR